MALEDTIRRWLFAPRGNMNYRKDPYQRFVIECKVERGKPVPLCVPRRLVQSADLAYRKLNLYDPPEYFCMKSTPRAMYNWMFSGCLLRSLVQMKIKDIVYYCAAGTLFDANKSPLFYFAVETDENNVPTPRLYLTDKLLANAATRGRPMEKFFMSTIVPFLIDNNVYDGSGSMRNNNSYKKVVIEMDNHVEDTFFMPTNNFIKDTSADSLIDKLNDVLVNNTDTLVSFLDNYSST